MAFNTAIYTTSRRGGLCFGHDPRTNGCHKSQSRRQANAYPASQSSLGGGVMLRSGRSPCRPAFPLHSRPIPPFPCGTLAAMRPRTVTIYRVDRFTCTSPFTDIRSSPNRVISEVVPRSGLLKKACGAEIPSDTGQHYSYDEGWLPSTFRACFGAIFTKAKIEGGFRGAGLVPFNPRRRDLKAR